MCRPCASLRLASTSTIAEAQAVLERFNARFADPGIELGAVLGAIRAFRRTRAVAGVAIQLRTVAAHQN